MCESLGQLFRLRVERLPPLVEVKRTVIESVAESFIESVVSFTSRGHRHGHRLAGEQLVETLDRNHAIDIKNIARKCNGQLFRGDPENCRIGSHLSAVAPDGHLPVDGPNLPAGGVIPVSISKTDVTPAFTRDRLVQQL